MIAETCVQAAIGLGEAKVPGVTDKLLQLVMSLYKAQDSHQQRANFLTLICRDFGVQSKYNTSPKGFPLARFKGCCENAYLKGKICWHCS